MPEECNKVAVGSLSVGENPEGLVIIIPGVSVVGGGGEAPLGLGIAWEGSLNRWKL